VGRRPLRGPRAHGCWPKREWPYPSAWKERSHVVKAALVVQRSGKIALPASLMRCRACEWKKLPNGYWTATQKSRTQIPPLRPGSGSFLFCSRCKLPSSRSSVRCPRLSWSKSLSACYTPTLRATSDAHPLRSCSVLVRHSLKPVSGRRGSAFSQPKSYLAAPTITSTNG
jgi:hypothetical protein